MKKSRLAPALTVLVATVAAGNAVHAATAGFAFNGPGVSGNLVLTYGAATTISGLALATTGAPLAVLPAYRSGEDYLLAAGAALALGALVELLGHWPGWRRWLLLPVTVAGAAGSLGVALAVGHVPLVAAAILGVLVAAVSHALRRVLTPLPGAGALQARMAMGAASVLVVGVVVYLITRLFAA